MSLGGSPRVAAFMLSDSSRLRPVVRTVVDGYRAVEAASEKV